MQRTILYLGVLTGLFLLIGYGLGGQQGALTALVFAAILNFGSYWFSDKLVLAMYQAKEIAPQEAPELYSLVQRLCMKAQLPLPKIYLIPELSPNAFATGRDEHHAVLGVTQGLLNIMEPDELAGVISHELAHVKNKDMLTSSIAATLAGAISQLAHFAFLFSGRGNDENRSGPLEFFIFLVLTPIIAMLIQLAVSREREYKADASGAELMGSGVPLARALKKLHAAVEQHPMQGDLTQQATAHLFIVNPFTLGFFSRIFSTHPPLEDRITRLTKGSMR